MPDLNSDALGIWEHLKPAIDKEIEQKTRGMVQRRKMKVTTAPSIATGKIGVTEAFGTTEMAIPFATNLISATVGDMVWVEFMYGATNAFASMFASADEKDWDVAGDLTVHGVLDVIQRRCYGTLSSAGWYRVCELQYTSGSILDLSIGINSTLARKITLMFPSVGLAKFVDETSVSTANNVFDKIRFTGIGGSTQKCYVDLHCNASSATKVSVFWTPTGNWTNSCVSKGLQSVADSPSGETVVKEYTFSENGTGDLTVNGVLDVTQRRSYEWLSQRGWYRVFDYNADNEARVSGDIAFLIDVTVLEWARQSHKITLYGLLGALKFGNEVSVTILSYVDKIRYVKNGNHGYIDIHYDGSSSRHIACYFDVKCVYIDNLWRFTAVTPTKADDSPAYPETVLMEYTFAANTEATEAIVAGTYTGTIISGTHVHRQGNIVTGFVKVQLNATATAGGWRNIAVIPSGFRPWVATDFNAIDNSSDEPIHARIDGSTGNVNIWPLTDKPSGRNIYLSFTYYTG